MAFHHGSGPPPGQPFDGRQHPSPMAGPPRPYGNMSQFPHAGNQPYPVATSGYLPAAQGPLYAQPTSLATPSHVHPHHRPQQQQYQQHQGHQPLLPQQQQQQQQRQQQPPSLAQLPPPVGYPTNTGPQSYRYDATAFAPQGAPAGHYSQQPQNHYAQPVPVPRPAPAPAAVHRQQTASPLQQQLPPISRYTPQQHQHQQQQAQQVQQQQHQHQNQHQHQHQDQQPRQNPPQPTQHSQQQPLQRSLQPLQLPQQHPSSAPHPAQPGGGITINIGDMHTRPTPATGREVDHGTGAVKSPAPPTPRAISKSPALSHSSGLKKSPALKKLHTGAISKATGMSKSPAISKSPALSNSPTVTRSPSVSSPQSLDHPSLLIHIADECLSKAQEGALQLAASGSPEGVNEYHKLVATGLACLEAAITSNRLPPRIEAKARLRYSGIVVEETEDIMNAETMLSKGIALADKRLFHDLKYCMQYLLMKALFRRTPKGAMVALNKIIEDCDTYKHVYWSYAFRFLKVSLVLQSPGPSDVQVVLDNIRDITTLAVRRGDGTLFVFASLLEGLVHLKTDKADAVMRVQGCIAQAAKYQLEESTHIAQIDILVLLLDLACSLRQKNPESSMNKMRNLHNALEAASSKPWETTELLLPISRDTASTSTISKDTGAIVRPGEGNNDFLVVSFMSMNDVFSLSYAFSGIAMLYTAFVTGDSYSGQAVDPRCPESWKEALKSLSRFGTQKLPPNSQMSLQQAMRLARWHSELKCYVYVLLGLTSGTHSEWAEVQQCVDSVDGLMEDSMDQNLQDLALYLKAVCYQGRCKLNEALKIFSDDRFAIRHPRGPDADNTVTRELCLMAALNRLWIMTSPKHQDNAKTMEIVEDIQGICETHPDPDIKTVFNLVMASIDMDPPQTINQVKRYIQGALNGSQINRNLQCLSIALNIMRYRLFEGVVGEQALKSARAASLQASKVGNLLWRSVAEGMLASSYKMQSQGEEFQRRHADAVRFANEARAKSEAVP